MRYACWGDNRLKIYTMFIVLEGLDGAGKSTQIELLRRMCAERGIESEFVHFPRFDAPVYGELIARFLRGDMGHVPLPLRPYAAGWRRARWSSPTVTYTPI